MLQEYTNNKNNKQQIENYKKFREIVACLSLLFFYL